MSSLSADTENEAASRDAREPATELRKAQLYRQQQSVSQINEEAEKVRLLTLKRKAD